MIVSATRRYIKNLEQLKKGELYSVDSNMGGAYTVRYNGLRKSLHNFTKWVDCGTIKQTINLTTEEVKDQVFINPPEDRYYRKLWDEERSKTPHYNSHYKANEAWFPAL